MLVDVETTRPGDGELVMADGTSSATVVGTADQIAGVTASSTLVASAAGACSQPQSAYVPLPQLIDHISPYTAVDTAARRNRP